ncbi:type II toxin-antitoxin system HicB family antitoxin [Candidatus Microgenomates bacterium]|nr:type II toxin-antitoxin system HicB family antitoxin [Candidatus Microgenomates bacterium]
MTTNLNYLIKLTYDRSYKGYVADVVNLYGCMSQGKTKKEALNNTKKAINAYMEALTKREKSQEKAVVSVPFALA